MSVAFWYITAFKELFRVQFISKRLNIFSDNKTLTFKFHILIQPMILKNFNSAEKMIKCKHQNMLLDLINWLQNIYLLI